MTSSVQPQVTHWERLPRIETDRVALRWISAADTDAFYDIYSHPEVMRYWSTPPLVDRDKAASLISEIQESWQRRAILKWGIARRSDDLLIGSLTLFNLDFTHRRAEIGYALGREFWGVGYMHEALTALLGYAFETLDLHRLEADVDPQRRFHQNFARFGFQRRLPARALAGCRVKFKTRCFTDCFGASGARSKHEQLTTLVVRSSMIAPTNAMTKNILPHQPDLVRDRRLSLHHQRCGSITTTLRQRHAGSLQRRLHCH